MKKANLSGTAWNENEIKPASFRRWFAHFMQKVQTGDEHQMFGSANEEKSENVAKKFVIMVKSFCSYHEIEIPDKLHDAVKETEVKAVTGSTCYKLM